MSKLSEDPLFKKMLDDTLESLNKLENDLNSIYEDSENESEETDIELNVESNSDLISSSDEEL